MELKINNNEIDLKKIRIKFNEVWPKLLEDISNDTSFLNITECVLWLDTVLKRNVPKGKQNRALTSIIFYHHLINITSTSTTTENEELSYILGWCCEISQGAAIIADDIMDGSETRRGDICWYKEPKVGLTAVNDAFLLENITYFILYKYFSKQSYFPRLLESFHDTTMKTVMGQSMDTRLAMDFTMEECTLEKYKRIVEYKTSYYSFYQPFAIALIMADITDKSIFELVKNITLTTGYLFQIQDDYLDCYGNINMTGKVGTDIVDKKCTWLLVTALENATEKQKEILNISYGSKLQTDEDIVKQIYKDIKIKNLFRITEKKIYLEIGKLIQNLPTIIPQSPFMTLLNGIYRRNK